MKLSKKLIAEFEKHGFTVTVSVEPNTTYFLFSKFSPAGQDFNIEVYANDLDELERSLYSYWQDFDVSEEAYLWLDEFGHGKNGAPYEMIDVYYDFKECEQYCEDAYNIVRKYIRRIRRRKNNDF